MQSQFTFRITKKKKKKQPRIKLNWKPAKIKNSYWQERLHDSTMTWSKVKEMFDKAESYYLDINGRTILINGKEVTPYSAEYILGRLDGYTTEDKGQQLYAWKRRISDDSISDITFGSRLDFDTLVLKNLTNNKIQRL